MCPNRCAMYVLNRELPYHCSCVQLVQFTRREITEDIVRNAINSILSAKVSHICSCIQIHYSISMNDFCILDHVDYAAFQNTCTYLHAFCLSQELSKLVGDCRWVMLVNESVLSNANKSVCFFLHHELRTARAHTRIHIAQWHGEVQHGDDDDGNSKLRKQCNRTRSLKAL